jgi:hypothetical protein
MLTATGVRAFRSSSRQHREPLILVSAHVDNPVVRPWLVLLGPVALCGAAALIGYAVMADRSERVRESRLPLKLLLVAAAMAPLAWILVRAAPEELDYNSGGMCPAVDDGLWSYVFFALYLGSAVVGGVALAASLVSAPSLKKPAGFLLVALGVPYAIGFMFLVAAFCGMN